MQASFKANWKNFSSKFHSIEDKIVKYFLVIFH